MINSNQALLDRLRLNTIGDCKQCNLCSSRTNIVFGEGNPNAQLIFIAEAPGEVEDKTTRPLIGPAGQVLRRLISSLGLKVEDCYLCNVIKCRPPNNRTPTALELSTCYPFLEAQISIIKPKIIVALGKIAFGELIGDKKAPMKDIRGQWFYYAGVIPTIPVMPTYHPSYILRNEGTPKEEEVKVQVWSDMQKVLEKLNEL